MMLGLPLPLLPSTQVLTRSLRQTPYATCLLLPAVWVLEASCRLCGCVVLLGGVVCVRENEEEKPKEGRGEPAIADN